MRTSLSVLPVLLLGACTGGWTEPEPTVAEVQPAQRVEQPPPTPAPPAPVALSSELRRLTRTELAVTIQDVLGTSPVEIFTALPTESGAYENDATKQQPSAVFVEGWEGIARAAAKDTVARRKHLLRVGGRVRLLG